MRTAALLQLDGLHAHYGASHVLHGVSLAVAPGESVGLLGRNGMGKTTLIKSALGLLRPSAGSVRVRGADCSGEARALRADRIARRGIAYVPEGRGIFPNLDVRENLRVAARPGINGRSDWTEQRVLDTFPRLKERLGHGGQQLSGGEQQMLAIGRALMTNPRLLLLDEATEGLAPRIRAEIWRVLATLKEAGQAILVVDKNIAPLLRLADRHYLLERGRTVWSGSSAELAGATDLQHRYLGV